MERVLQHAGFCVAHGVLGRVASCRGVPYSSRRTIKKWAIVPGLAHKMGAGSELPLENGELVFRYVLRPVHFRVCTLHFFRRSRNADAIGVAEASAYTVPASAG